MKPLPPSDDPLIVRTDFSDQETWEKVRKIIETPYDVFQAYVEFVDDRIYEGLTIDDVVNLESEHTFIFLVDTMTLTHTDNPLLCIDLYTQLGDSFRTVPREVAPIENNLSIANLFFEEFANEVDEDGIFRGFNDG